MSSVLRKAGDISSHITSAFAVHNLLPQPWLCREEAHPCHHTHFIWQKEAKKEAPGCSVLLSSCDCAASGLAQLPGEPHRNENSKNNPR